MTTEGTPPTDRGDPSPSGREVDPSLSGRLCKGKSKKGARPCAAFPVRGALVCVAHGGAAPQVKAAAARRVAEREAMAELSLLGRPLSDVDPSSLVLDEIAAAGGFVAALRDRVAAMDPTDAIASPWLRKYDEERDRLVKFSDLAVRMNISIRRQELAEQVGALVVTVLRGVLDELGLTADQHELAAAAVPRHLTVIAGELVEGVA